MYSIVDYDKRYKPYDKSGGELKRADWVKLPAKPRGDGLDTLFEYRRGLEVFAVWCLLLEKTTLEEPDNRGKLLNHKGEPASVDEIAKGINLKKKVSLVEYALSVLAAMGWVKTETVSEEFRKTSSKGSVVKSRVEKGRVRKFIPPTLEEVQQYIQENKYDVDARKFIKYYTDSDPPWHDQNGKPVRNWKQKIIAVWADKDTRLKPKQCTGRIRGARCKKPATFLAPPDTAGIERWYCEGCKPKYKPLKNMPQPQLQTVPGKTVNDRNKQKDELGVR